MDSFFKCLEGKYGEYKILKSKVQKKPMNSDDAVCDEELLAAFGKWSYAS